ncbi:hypothetical protein [Mycoplasma sp. 'Moose RK']|uniref:hypothetical protein n=1 Tax=Mycoplasma sp. 'Moose RK' TaxID=2780095 RepID=UPI0018C23B96|nr:hypothetical protein [Mycoplasma sp. 'Moose RK']MBG0730490.1 hypothetical protein [Mycoplasma sp. 'Moose RK']MBG0730740.1 hypothetical protein [Mycoplasma sp. 'Moose RK']
MQRNNLVNVLIKKTPRGDSKNSDLIRDFKKVYQSKNFLDYLARLSANICLDSATLHEAWSLHVYYEDQEDGFKKFLKGILKEQELNPQKFKPKLFQILGKDKTAIVDLKIAKKQIGEVKQDQAVWPYLVSFKDYQLITKNKLLSLEDYANFIAPELIKWLKKNFLDINNLNIYGGVHFDTAHPHIQLWISEKKPSLKHDKTVRFDRRDKFDINRRDFELELETKLLQGFKNNKLKANEEKNDDSQKNFDKQVLNLRSSKLDYFEELKKFKLDKIKETKEMKIAGLTFENQDLYSIVEKARKAKLITNLMLSTSEMTEIISNLSRAEKEILFNSNSAKYYKYLQPNQKKIIDDIYERVLDSDSILKSKKKYFEIVLNQVKSFTKSENEVVANKAKNISRKEEKNLFLSSRNFILKEIRNFYGLDNKKTHKSRRSQKYVQPKYDPLIFYVFKKWKYKLTR